MQTLWSRVAQVKGSCRCPQCVSSTHGVSRRAAASATRRIPRINKPSTLLFSSLFATACTIDQGVKLRRRDQWDTAIAAVKQELEMPTKAEMETKDMKHQGATTSALDELADQLDPFKHTTQTHQARMPRNMGQPVPRPWLPAESIYADDRRKERAKNTCWSAKKLALTRVWVDILQIRIWLVLQGLGWEWQAGSEVPKSYAKRILDDRNSLLIKLETKRELVRRLQSCKSDLSDFQAREEDEVSSTFVQDEQGHYHSAAHELNNSLRDIFSQRERESDSNSKRTLLATISYRLATSSAPPNIDTYNIALIGLSRSNDDHLFKTVLQVLRRTNMRLNETSLVTIFDHFTRTDQVDQFAHWVDLMRGNHCGLALARPGINITDAGRMRLIPHKKKPDKIIQLPAPTPDVFGALIAGMLHFGGFHHALTVCENLGQEGWGLCMGGMVPLLRDCERRRDWTSGLVVWQKIKKLQAMRVRQVSSKTTLESIELGTYALMLRLCRACDQEKVFDEVMTEANKEHRVAKKQLLSVIRKQITAEQAENGHEHQQVRDGLAQTESQPAEERQSVAPKNVTETNEAKRLSPPKSAQPRRRVPSRPILPETRPAVAPDMSITTFDPTSLSASLAFHPTVPLHREHEASWKDLERDLMRHTDQGASSAHRQTREHDMSASVDTSTPSFEDEWQEEEQPPIDTYPLTADAPEQEKGKISAQHLGSSSTSQPQQQDSLRDAIIDLLPSQHQKGIPETRSMDKPSGPRRGRRGRAPLVRTVPSTAKEPATRRVRITGESR